MRRIRYLVATSLDGFIAGTKGEADWIPNDPEFDFGAIFKQFDTFLIGRRTFETMAAAGHGSSRGMRSFVFSRTLRPADYPKVTVVAEKPEDVLASIKAKPGKDIWLFGGGSLFRSLAGAGLVDTVEVAVVPILLGGGIPLLATPAGRIPLTLTGHKVYKTGVVSLEYQIKRS